MFKVFFNKSTFEVVEIVDVASSLRADKSNLRYFLSSDPSKLYPPEQTAPPENFLIMEGTPTIDTNDLAALKDMARQVAWHEYAVARDSGISYNVGGVAHTFLTAEKNRNYLMGAVVTASLEAVATPPKTVFMYPDVSYQMVSFTLEQFQAMGVAVSKHVELTYNNALQVSAQIGTAVDMAGLYATIAPSMDYLMLSE